MWEDEALIDEYFIFDLNIFCNNTHTFYAYPLSNDTLPANYWISDESMSLNYGLIQNASLRDTCSFHDDAIFTNHNIRSNDTGWVNLGTWMYQNIPNDIISLSKLICTCIFQMLKVIFSASEEIFRLANIHPKTFK